MVAGLVVWTTVSSVVTHYVRSRIEWYDQSIVCLGRSWLVVVILAFFGVLIVGPLMTRMLYRGDRQPSSGVQIIMESVAAQLMTLPIILLAFGNLPVLAIIANLVTAPIIPVAMAITFLCGVIAMIVPATVIGIPAEIILSYFVAVTNFLSSPSWSQQQVTISWQFMLMLYSLIAVAMLLIWRHWRVSGNPSRGSSTIE